MNNRIREIAEDRGRRSRGQVIDLFTKKSKTCPSDLTEREDKGKTNENMPENLLFSDILFIFAHEYELLSEMEQSIQLNEAQLCSRSV